MTLPEHERRGSQQGGFLTSRAGLALLVFLAVAGLLLLTEHRAHVIGAAFWLLPLVCIAMHMFMHGGHGGHGQRSEGSAS
ncbi:MAG: DUF2933 domain-containing protein [Xanthobacteraceae bacterium]|nr:DUF2933 domain-containing protein [Xanthobacteraceae bacterium]PWB64270.1 MAG: hypothetical protein C3F17_07525 [Bradyrhizobiaceae bacterium]GIK80614.1 MAG: hypothetical protein BroJett024_17190 [Alphaproteobacteria bacterium]